ncbi:gluconokinase [Kitasatospora sp. NPDC048540]|uniref:gluconokinase n=1 Tax=unclassified Kitasatospora TaxID=2633591 RepID=UPI000539E4EC|nr:gluconokinase [Kitasatospora sp. MBT63]
MATEADPGPGPTVLVVLGVAGCGKSTVGALLAERLGWAFEDADDLHAPQARAKMAAGHPLTDEDRRPWLLAVAHWADERIAAGESAVVACSALRRSYRDLLREGRPQVRMVYLKADRALVAERLTERHGHFFPARLMDSQFAELEEPGPGEDVVVVPVGAGPDDSAARTADTALALLAAERPDTP